VLVVNYKYTTSGHLRGEYTPMLTVIKINTKKIKNILKSTATMVFPHFYAVRNRSTYFFLLFASRNNCLLLFKKPYDEKWNETINNAEDFIHIDILGGDDWVMIDVVNDVNPYIGEGTYSFAVLRQNRVSKRLCAIFYQYKYPTTAKGSLYEINRVEFFLENRASIPCKLFWDSKNEVVLLICFAPPDEMTENREYKLCLNRVTFNVSKDNPTDQMINRQIFETPTSFVNSPDTPFLQQNSFWNEEIGSVLMFLSQGRLFSFRFFFPTIDSKETTNEQIKESNSLEGAASEWLLLSQFGELISRKAETNQVSVIQKDGKVFIAIVRSEESKVRKS